jgi:hypothetical protein
VHPDKCAHPQATSAFQCVAGAYAKLKTTELRAEYETECRTKHFTRTEQGAAHSGQRQQNFRAEVPMADAFAMFSTVFSMANAARQAGAGAGAGGASTAASAAAASMGVAAAASMMGGLGLAGGGMDDLSDILKSCEGILGGTAVAGAASSASADMSVGGMVGVAGLALTALSATGAGSSRLQKMKAVVQVAGVAATLLSNSRAQPPQPPR